jgi:hypothetical protein
MRPCMPSQQCRDHKMSRPPYHAASCSQCDIKLLSLRDYSSAFSFCPLKFPWDVSFTFTFKQNENLRPAFGLIPKEATRNAGKKRDRTGFDALTSRGAPQTRQRSQVQHPSTILPTRHVTFRFIESPIKAKAISPAGRDYVPPTAVWTVWTPKKLLVFMKSCGRFPTKTKVRRHSIGSIQVRILRRRYCSSRIP